jgi:hypothetical protein
MQIFLVTRLEAPGKLSLKEYKTLPVGSEVFVWDKWPLDFMDKDIALTVARERQYKIRRVDRHPLRDHMKP